MRLSQGVVIFSRSPVFIFGAAVRVCVSIDRSQEYRHHIARPVLAPLAGISPYCCPLPRAHPGIFELLLLALDDRGEQVGACQSSRLVTTATAAGELPWPRRLDQIVCIGHSNPRSLEAENKRDFHLLFSGKICQNLPRAPWPTLRWQCTHLMLCSSPSVATAARHDVMNEIAVAAEALS